NAIAPLVAASIRANARLPANSAGEARLAAAVALASHPPGPLLVSAIPAWALAISSRTFVVSGNPLGLRTIRLSFPRSDQASVQLGFATGAMENFPVGLDGVPRLSWDASSGHRVAMLGSWSPNAFYLDYNTVACI